MIIRRATLDDIYDQARAAGLHTALRLVTVLDLPVRRADGAAIRLLYPLVVDAIEGGRRRWLAASADGRPFP
ncbi:hypothetical protein AB0I55_00300 [Actinocatenispora sera]|uniref:hypothetical protein n=1 Tax=Actinocatenispora sera TaxID=390989 RepID=UPI0033E0E8E4